ncbi:MAG: hypothetical protein Kow0026_19910 [Oricola sp.]
MAQPNEFDHRRIARALELRRRYRYVTPRVLRVEHGYRIEAPCCSRTVDPDGGTVDVALVLFDQARGEWRLFRRDHESRSWELHSVYSGLHHLLDYLNADPERKFWQ